MTQGVKKRIFHAFDEKHELLLNKSLRTVNSLGCDYFYYLVTDYHSTNKSYRFCTHEDWMDFYYDEKLIDNDPLKRMVMKENSSVILWNQASFMNKSEKRTMSGRSYFGLYNGITITNHINDKKFTFTLATEQKDHDLARYMLLEKDTQLKKLMYNCISAYGGCSKKMASL